MHAQPRAPLHQGRAAGRLAALCTIKLGMSCWHGRDSVRTRGVCWEQPQSWNRVGKEGVPSSKGMKDARR